MKVNSNRDRGSRIGLGFRDVQDFRNLQLTQLDKQLRPSPSWKRLTMSSGIGVALRRSYSVHQTCNLPWLSMGQRPSTRNPHCIRNDRHTCPRDSAGPGVLAQLTIKPSSPTSSSQRQPNKPFLPKTPKVACLQHGSQERNDDT